MYLRTQILILASAWLLGLPGCSASRQARPDRPDVPRLAAAGAEQDDEFDLLEEDIAETIAEREVRISDPLKPLNRAVHNFNDKFYFWLLKPCARACKGVLPVPVRTGVRNFFSNLTTPARWANCLLQGKRKEAGRELHRFAINTTVGVLGFGDPARDKYGLETTHEDLGQTLAKFGFGHGVYIVLPVLGPSSVRDGLGLAGDQFLNPVRYVEPVETSIMITAGKTVNEYSFKLGEYEALKESAIDPYTAIKNAYIQYRARQIEQ